MDNPFISCINDGDFVLVTTTPEDWYDGHWFNGPGWYYGDGGNEFVGPYDTKELAQVAYYRYCEFCELYADELADAEAGHPYGE